MGFSKLSLGLIVILFLISLSPTPLFAAKLSAKFHEVSGKVDVTTKKTGKVQSASVGMKVLPGDIIKTGARAEAEIVYSDGNVTVIDEKTTLIIKELSINHSNDRSTVLELTIGRVKNSVTKAVRSRTKFEVHTKTATMGVTGTPPWVVEVREVSGGKIQTDVDLLGKLGDSGSIFVSGYGKTVNLKPRTRTIVLECGGPNPLVKNRDCGPRNPFAIGRGRLNLLNSRLKIKTPWGSRRGRPSMMRHITNKVSVSPPSGDVTGANGGGPPKQNKPPQTPPPPPCC